VRTATVLVQNVDSVSRHLRILPPATRVFALASPAFPGGDSNAPAGSAAAGAAPPSTLSSAVAPGMAVRLTVTFAPPAAAPFSDAITLVTEGGTATVPLLATLRPAELSLPLTLPLGASLVHDVVTHRFAVENLGATAQFRLLPAEAFDAGALPAVAAALSAGGGGTLAPGTVEGLPEDVSIAGDALWFGPFCVWPAVLDVPRGARAELAVRFAPAAVGPAARAFVVLASDGSV
jgi:hypothetical protein